MAARSSDGTGVDSGLRTSSRSSARPRSMASMQLVAHAPSGCPDRAGPGSWSRCLGIAWAVAGRCRRARDRAAPSAADGRLGGLRLTPLGHLLGDGGGPAPEPSGLLDPPPRGVGIAVDRGPWRPARRTRSRTQAMPAPGFEIGREQVVELEQVHDVGFGVSSAASGSGPDQPVGQAVGLGEVGVEQLAARAAPDRSSSCRGTTRRSGCRRGRRARRRPSAGRPRGPGRRRASRWCGPRAAAPSGRGRRRGDRPGPAGRPSRSAPGRTPASRCARGGTRCRCRRGARSTSSSTSAAKLVVVVDPGRVESTAPSAPSGTGVDRLAGFDPGHGAAGDVDGVDAVARRNSTALRAAAAGLADHVHRRVGRELARPGRAPRSSGIERDARARAPPRTRRVGGRRRPARRPPSLAARVSMSISGMSTDWIVRSPRRSDRPQTASGGRSVGACRRRRTRAGSTASTNVDPRPDAAPTSERSPDGEHVASSAGRPGVPDGVRPTGGGRRPPGRRRPRRHELPAASTSR